VAISARIQQRIREAGGVFRANDSIAAYLLPGELAALESEVADKLRGMLDALVIDQSDPNTIATAERMARMYLQEVFAGRYEKPPRLTDFPNGKELDELYAVGPCEIRSACSHHFCPVEGQLWCGVIPKKRIIGLSKFSRLARWIMCRPQIQEEAVVQLADCLEELLQPRGLAVVMRLRHSCMTWRGVREHNTVMTSSVTRGIMRESPAARAEFFQLIGASPS
jgi:GTP cyclohydrolase IA